MAKSEQIRVMISSRCKASISYQGKKVLLSKLRGEQILVAKRAAARKRISAAIANEN